MSEPMQDIETLRNIADLIRSRAKDIEKYAPWQGDWDSCDCGDGYGCSHGSWIHSVRFATAVIDYPEDWSMKEEYERVAEVGELPDSVLTFWMAFTPAFGLALADWLDLTAKQAEDADHTLTVVGSEWVCASDCAGCLRMAAALAVANGYLRTPAPRGWWE